MALSGGFHMYHLCSFLIFKNQHHCDEILLLTLGGKQELAR